MSRVRLIAIYAAWILLCAALFVVLRGAEDPSRRRDRILSTDAGARALSILRQRDPVKFREYEVVHVAFARAAEGAPERRWIVLADRVPHTALSDAIVVELRAEDGTLLRIRKPIN